jgi:hypothetical protein
MSRFRKGKRQAARTKSVVPVLLWIAGSKDSHLAHLEHVSQFNLRLRQPAHAGRTSDAGTLTR